MLDFFGTYYNFWRKHVVNNSTYFCDANHISKIRIAHAVKESKQIRAYKWSGICAHPISFQSILECFRSMKTV